MFDFKISKIAISLTMMGLLTACGDNVNWDDNNGASQNETDKTPITVDKFSGQFYFGNDLSYTNQMEDCQAVFREGGVAQDPYTLLASRGSNLARFRNWVNPGNWQNLIVQPESVSSAMKAQYNDLADNIEGMRRAKEAGMDTLLSLHLSDVWADPGQQSLPKDWEALFDDEVLLAEAVYEYVTNVMTSLNNEGLAPDIISIGNESNMGLLLNQNYTATPTPEGGVDFSFSEGRTAEGVRSAALYNAGIKAVRDFAESHNLDTKISLHMTVQALQSSNSVLNGEYARLINELGVTDFDIIGLSYYPHFHSDVVTSIDDLARYIKQLRSAFPEYDVMIAETAYPWTFDWGDSYGNVLGTTDPDYAKPSIQNQLKFMTDLTQAVIESGGAGVVYWEPTWIATECRDAWGQGSSWENASYFDFHNNNNIHAGANWMQIEYLSEKPNQNTGVETRFKVDLSGHDTAQGIYIEGDFTGWTRQPMIELGNQVYAYDTNLPFGGTGSYRIANGLEPEDAEMVPQDCAAPGEEMRREFALQTDSTEINSVWASCDTFDRPTSADVRINVDTGSADTGKLFIAGNFNNYIWEPMIPMEANGDPGIYSFLVNDLEPGTDFTYYLSKTFDGGNIENVPDSCGAYNVRSQLLPEFNTYNSFNTVWETCQQFAYDDPAFPSLEVETTFIVDVTGANLSNGVYIVGTFPDDTGTAWGFQELTAIDENTYSWTTTLIAGDYHGYYFLSAADWGAKEPIPASCSHREWDGSRGLEVPYTDSLVKNLTWGVCEASGTNESAVETSLVTFEVDAAGVDDSQGIYIVGTVTDDGVGNWLFEPMTKDDDGKYRWSKELEVGSYHSFYFVNNADWAAEFKEPIPEECSHTEWAANRGIEIVNETTMTVQRDWGICQSN